ncbi:MAG: hypothetical protein ACTJF3_11275, partial [Glutamicibacter arilaitensis]
ENSIFAQIQAGETLKTARSCGCLTVTRESLDFAFGSNPCNLVSCDQHGKQNIPGPIAERLVQMKQAFF